MVPEESRLTSSFTLAWLRPSLKVPDDCRYKQNSAFGSWGLTLCIKLKFEWYNKLAYPLVPCNPFMVWDPDWVKGFCESCRVTAQNTHATGRMAVWDKLPGILGLPAQEELETKWSTVCQFLVTSIFYPSDMSFSDIAQLLIFLQSRMLEPRH